MEECAPGLLALPRAGGAPVLVVAGGAIPPEHRGHVHPHDAPVDARAGGGEGGGGGGPVDDAARSRSRSLAHDALSRSRTLSGEWRVE